MNPLARATALLFGSSTASLLMLFATTKVWTLLVGPVGLGLITLHQGLVVFTAMIAGLGAGVGVVRLGAGDDERLATLRAAAWRLYWAIGLPAAAAMVAGREPVAHWVLGAAEHAAGVAWMALALLFSLAAGLQNGLLGAHHRVGELARMNVVATVLGCAASVALIGGFGQTAIPWAVLAIYAATWAVSWWLLTRSVERKRPPPDSAAIGRAMRELARFGLPYTASMVVGAGVAQWIPVLVLHALGAGAVGYYRAAVLIADNALGGLLNVMIQDYYPRAAAAEGGLGELVNQQHRLIVSLAFPMVFTLYALAPWVIPLAYSGEFAPMQALLEWLLVAALIKFAAWSSSFMVLARSTSSAFFVLEATAGVVNIGLSVALLPVMGLPGLGVAALVTALAYHAVGWALLRRQIGLKWTRENKWLLAAALVTGLGLQALPALGLAAWKPAVALSIAAVGAIGALRAVRVLLGQSRKHRLGD